MRQFNLYLSNTSGNQANCLYPNQVSITSKEDLEKAIKLDHVCCKLKRSYRANANFISSNVIALDCDNEGDDPSKWLEPVDLTIEFPEACFYVVYSRNHMKQKGDKSPRPRFHVYFPIEEVSDPKKYHALKQMIVDRFPYFDTNAMDNTRFLYGCDGEVEVNDGEKTIIDVIGQEDKFEQFDQETLEIKQGSRNSSMSLIAGKIIKRLGNTDEAYDTYLKKAEMCNPPLSQEELDTIWHSATKFGKKVSKQEGYIPPEKYNNNFTYKPNELTDIGQARMLAKVYKDVLAYTPSTDFIVFNGSYWDESKEKAQGLSQELTLKQLAEAKDKIDKAIQELSKNGCLKTVLLVGAKKAKESYTGSKRRAIEKLEEAQDYEKYVLKRQDSKCISAALREVKPMVSVEQQEFDANEFLLNTPSFTYDLRKGVAGMCMHSSKDKLTKQTKADPSEDGKDIWQDALNTFFEGDKDLIEYVQTIVGLAAIGKVFVEALIIAYGEGRNGKSTFWNVISKVLGSYSGNVSADVLTAACKRNVKPELAEAKGKRLLIAAELQEGMRLNTSSVKQLCSTDDIYAEKKYKAPFSYTPSHTLVLYTNHLPKVGAIDEGTWRRLIVIPFNAKLNGKQEIKNYADYLFDNASGYIMTWIIEGSKKAIDKEYKIEPPLKVKEMISQYKEDNDWFSLFISECCEVGGDYQCKPGELYTEYRLFCMRSSEFIRSTTEFYSALKAHGFNRQHTKKGNFVYKLKLKSEFLED